MHKDVANNELFITRWSQS